MSEGTEARRDPRYDMRRPVRIIPPGREAISGLMQNISRGGTLIALPVELELGRTYEIEVTDSRGAFRLPGEALRIHLPSGTSGAGPEAAGFKIGFEFVGIDPAAGERLDRLLAEAAA